MKSIKDLRESYNLITEKEEHDMNKLTQLVRAGLFDAKKRLQDVKGIGIFEFSNQDIVRNPIIGEILQRYD